MKYVMSDLHGCYDEFKQMLKKINFSEQDELYIIGDVIDRGQKSISLLLYIMKQENMFLIMGNHEKMMLDALLSGDTYLWQRNGGIITYKQFEELSHYGKQDILKYLESLPLGIEVEVNNKKYILIHGGVNTTFIQDWEKGTLSENVLWERFDTLSNDEEVYPGKIIVVGHTPTSLYGKDGEIIKLKYIKLIDCGCVFGYTLGCMCLDTEECYYVISKPRRKKK